MGKREEKVHQMRSRLLDAAVTVLREEGVSRFTLDAVAQQAGVSKGGLLHHFASKEALIGQILQEMMVQFATNVEGYLAQNSEEPGGLLRAYVRASLEEAAPLFPALGALLAVAVLENTDLLAIVQADAQEWGARLAADAAAAGLPHGRAQLIRQAADGAWFDQLIGAAPVPGEREALLADLLALCGGSMR